MSSYFITFIFCDDMKCLYDKVFRQKNGNDAYLFMYFEVVLKKKIHVKFKKNNTFKNY